MSKILYFALCLLWPLASVHAQNLYKWVDEQGNVTYQDQPPPNAGNMQAFATDAEVLAETQNPAAGAIAENPVTLYSVNICDACDLVRNVLEKHNVPFTEKHADSDRSVQDELMKLSGQLSVPLLAIGPKVVYGYNSQAITDELARAGYPIEGRPGSAPGQSTLTPEEVQEQAAAAAEELISDGEPPDADIAIDLDTEPEQLEEIPEDERIQVNISTE